MPSATKSLLVPNSAIVRSTEREYVVPVSEDKAVLNDTKEGLTGHDSTQGFDSSKNRDQVIILASDNKKDGDLIR